MSEWQPIEAAPMKQDCLFYESTERKTFVGQVRRIEDCGDEKYYVVYTTIGECRCSSWEVTHWMPLPKPPM